MRVREWKAVNDLALVSVTAGAERVELAYEFSDTDKQISGELERLVQAEVHCCGAAGVAFELSHQPAGANVSLTVVSNGLPAKTVLAAFAAMAHPDGND